MATQDLAMKIQSDVFEWLKSTLYASTSLEPLSGGSANFIYKAHLSKALAEGTTDVVVKHGEAYMAVAPQNKVTVDRCKIENECLKALATFRIPNYIVKTPKTYFYDDAAHTAIQEYLPNGIDLKTYLLKSLASPTLPFFQPACHELGKSLSLYITELYQVVESIPDLHKELKGNIQMQDLKHMINYDWLLERVIQFPEILAEAKEVFVKVKEQALVELKSPKDLKYIHGDFWPGNILLPNALIEEKTEVSIFVIDWENAQLGVPAMDHGMMIGELYLLSLLKKTGAGLWIMQGYCRGLGDQTEDDIWRTVLQVGVHLLAFGTLDRGWGKFQQLQDVARIGRDIVVNAWERKQEWFEKSELKFMFD
ncbi:kinase-like domain-containing protein [Halenospora varia]|nr:kinase-like domain-containing protein [Halenospora varia]